MLVAIRIGPNRHISGILWQQDLVITSDQALPAQDSYTLVLPGGVLTAARPARRNAAGNLASLRLEGTADPVQILLPPEPRVGALALALGADADAAPMARLTVIHNVSANGTDRTLTLDMPADLVAEGGPVLDAAGGLLGMAIIGAERRGDCDPVRQHRAHARSGRTRRSTAGAAGWGSRCSRSRCPRRCAARSARRPGSMVVSLAPSGPAELAGLRPGDILLSLDGHSISGAHALRAFLGPEQVGRQVDVRLMRDGQMETRQLTIAPQPAG